MDILSHIHTHGTIFVSYLCFNRRISPGIASIGSPRLYLSSRITVQIDRYLPDKREFPKSCQGKYTRYHFHSSITRGVIKAKEDIISSKKMMYMARFTHQRPLNRPTHSTTINYQMQPLDCCTCT